MFGKILIYAFFGTTAISSLLYIFSGKNNNNLTKAGRYAYYASFLILIFTSVYFLSNILAHNFQMTYIWQYSSKELPTHLLVSTFFAGQEGSFMLWALMVAFIGFFLIPYVKKRDYENQVMGIYALILAFLAIMLIAKSPFNTIWESFPDDKIAHDFMPANGRGLNPILENFWMVIHPPILFLGFAIMSVPYAFAIAGLMKKDYNEWVRVSMPWTLAAVGFLGLGIALGGFWSYETLGWGGYWAWDPVENSSLMPWILALALVHTLLVQNRTGGLVKTNFVLTILSFILVLYSTFLTRSGVLGDTSVHSFVDPGKFVYSMLLIFMLLFLAIGVVLLLVRTKDISAGKINFSASSREFLLSLGSILLILMTLLVFGGTSWPIMAEFFGMPKVAVDISFYNQWLMPLAVAILILNAAALYFRWKNDEIIGVIRKILPATIISVIVTFVLFLSGINDLTGILIIFASLFSLVINLDFLIKNIKRVKTIGAFMSHAGLALMMLGVVFSGPYSDSEGFVLIKGQSKKAFGYNFTFEEKVQVEKEKQDREKFEYRIKVEKDGESDYVSPVFYWSDFNNRQQPFLEPGIQEFLFSDIYVSPRSAEMTLDIPTVMLTKGMKKNIPVDSSISLQLEQFDMSKAQAMNSDNSVLLGAVMTISTQDSVFTDTLMTNMDMQSGECTPSWYKINDKYEAGFMQLIPNRENMAQSEAVFVFREPNGNEPAPIDILSFEVSVKPLISSVWLGMILIIAGFFFSMAKYLVKKNNEEN